MDWKKTIEAYDKIMSSETFHCDRKFRQKILLAFCNDMEMQTLHHHKERHKRRKEAFHGHQHRKAIGSRRRGWLSWRLQRHESSEP